MDLLTTISACSVAKDFTLVLVMVLSFSEGNPFMVKDAAEIETPPLYDPFEVSGDTEGAVQLPRTREAALAKLERLRAAHRAPVIGLLPVPPSWATNFRRTPRQLLEPCVNLSIGSAMIAQFEYECGRKAGRECVLERYAQAAGIDGFDVDVLDAIRADGHPEGEAVVLESEEVFSNPIHASANSDRDWGADRIFFTTRHESEVAPRAGAGAK